MASSSSSPKITPKSLNESLPSVLELTKKPLLSIPEQYVRTDREPVMIDDHDLSDASCNSFPEIPTIKFNSLVTEELADAELEKLHLACKDWGIFQLVDHEVSTSLLEKLKYETEDFFKLPLDEKMKYKIRPNDVEGYGTLYLTDNQKLDWGDRIFMITNPVHRRKQHLLPEFPSSLRTALESYLTELEKIATTLLRLLAKALKIKSESTVNELFEDCMQAVRMTYYPPCPEPEKVLGLTPHSDVVCLTILNQLNGVNGLEIKREGVWIPVNIPRHAFVVNVGDVLEIMSNGIYKSIEHRVTVNSMRERISTAMFFGPKFEADIEPFSSLISPLNPPLFRKIGMEKFIDDFFTRRKLAGKSFLEQMKIKQELTPVDNF